ncbi:MAG TPA: tetratricopeptide repeat protein [Bryobacteraceae bacterium]
MKSAHLRFWVLSLMPVLAVADLAFAQGRPGGGAGATTPGTPAPNVPGNPGTRNPTPNIPGTIPGQPQTPGQQLPYPDMNRPIFLSGKVVMDDGSKPPEPVAIERVCNGIVRREQFTDSKGHFSFQLGQNNYAYTDASTSAADGIPNSRGINSVNNMPGMPSRGFSERDLFGCELRASLPGFRSDVVNLANHRAMDNPDLGTIVLHRLGNVEGLTISATSMAAPKDARKAYEKGREAASKGKLEDGQKQLEKAVEVYPKYAVAWYELGKVHQQNKDIEGARKAFGEALKADPKFISPYDNMAQMAAQEQKWDEVADITDRMIRLNPVDFPNAYYLNGVANLNLHRLDAAQKSASYLVSQDTNHRMPRASYLLGIVLAQKQDWNGAATQLRTFIDHAPPGSDLETPKKQLADVERALATKDGSAEKKDDKP